ncbi:MAG: DNA topoisomerase IV subunit B [Verrucomicrobiota bacterium]
MPASYTEKDIKTLEWREHIRIRPGMYIGKLGDGSSPDDGIYVLLKEVIDNAIDEFTMGHGKTIEIDLEEGFVTVRDFGRGIPLGKLMDCAAKINTGAKYDSEAFKKSVGLNGVGIKAVNALSSFFEIQAFRDRKTKSIVFAQGEVVEEMKRAQSTRERDGTVLRFEADEDIFGSVTWNNEYVEHMLRNYAYLNTGLTLVFNGKKFKSKDGLLDLLKENISEEPRYPIAHFNGKDIEIAFTHGQHYGEEYYSFVNGQHTTQGGTHQAAFREAIVKTLREFFKKQYEPADIRAAITAAISVRVEEPVFESQTKTKLGSTHMAPGGDTIRNYVQKFLEEQVHLFLHRNKDVADIIQRKIVESEKERKDLKGIRTAAKEANRKAKVHNKKLRDCRIHLDSKNKRREESTVFITEGDSASGTFTAARDVETQAIFSLRGKPLNCFGLSRKVVYENEEFNLLQHALNIEEGLDGLRYNRVIVATDADVDGMHIRLLLLTFFLQFFPELIKAGHVHILQTPLFRVRNKKETHYCYSDEERRDAIAACGKSAEITRFKGLGEINSDEIKRFIAEDEIHLDPVYVPPNASIAEVLGFYMGKNTPERQGFIIENLRHETDLVEDLEADLEAESARPALKKKAATKGKTRSKKTAAKKPVVPRKKPAAKKKAPNKKKAANKRKRRSNAQQLELAV